MVAWSSWWTLCQVFHRSSWPGLPLSGCVSLLLLCETVTSFYAGFRKSIFFSESAVYLGAFWPRAWASLTSTEWMVWSSKIEFGFIFESFCEFTEKLVRSESIFRPKWIVLLKFRNLFRIACSEGGSILASWRFWTMMIDKASRRKYLKSCIDSSVCLWSSCVISMRFFNTSNLISASRHDSLKDTQILFRSQQMLHFG